VLRWRSTPRSSTPTAASHRDEREQSMLPATRTDPRESWLEDAPVDIAAVGVADAAVPLRPWPTERPFRVVLFLVSLPLWFAMFKTPIGLTYAVLIGTFFFVTRLAFIAHLRGSAVRLGPEQLPDLHQRVVELSARVGLVPPAAYVMQAGGALNA